DNPVNVVGNPTASPEATNEAVAVVPKIMPSSRFGRLSFSTVSKLGDTANLRVANLVAPEPGLRYTVWLSNTSTGETFSLGTLTLDGLGEGILTFTDTDGQSLPLLFNAVMITQENAETDDENRSVVYSGNIP